MELGGAVYTHAHVHTHAHTHRHAHTLPIFREMGKLIIDLHDLI